jgi:hypothetical protein
MKTKTLLCAIAALTLCSLATTSQADPSERAGMCKSLLTQRLMQDGWRLAQEGGMMLTFEKQSGFGQTFLMHAMTGSNSTWAITRLTLSVVPTSDHYTNIQYAFSVNDQNAFGQSTSVPVGNKKDAQYIEGIVRWASSQLPARYKKQ